MSFTYFLFFSFFFNDTGSTEIYTLSYTDALPICISLGWLPGLTLTSALGLFLVAYAFYDSRIKGAGWEAFFYTGLLLVFEIGRAHAELQSHVNLVCRLLLEKKNRTIKTSVGTLYS